MKILAVIHGYPDFYMAGSEVYTYNLCNEWAKEHEIELFTRYENPYEPAYSLLIEEVNGIKVTRVNKPQRDYTFQDKYLDPQIDRLFEEKLLHFQPDVVYIGHLSHLSTRIPIIARSHGVKVFFTIHDFWLFCYRGQMMTTKGTICSHPSKANCFQCAKDTFKHCISPKDIDVYREHLDKTVEAIDLFFAPSKTLYHFFQQNGVSEEKLLYSRYGFDKNRITRRYRHYTKESNIRFGFMGRVIPVKGMKVLFEAFSQVPEAQLTIYGRQADKKYLDLYHVENVRYYGMYHNEKIDEVLEEIDVLIVPSLWLENSPLVIQEAFLAGIPVITSNIGGMAELVQDGKNGFLFEVGDANALAEVVKGILRNPEKLNELSVEGSEVRDIREDAQFIISKMRELSKTNHRSLLKHHDYPWRMTFDTNPGICNLRCEMCEVHSDYNTDRRAIKQLPVMPFEMVERIIEEGSQRGLREIIPSTMGEPLLYEHFDEMVELCRRHGLKMNLTTNGTFPKRSTEEWAEMLLPICSDIKISQNEWLTKENPTIMRGTTPKKTYENVKIFLQKREELRARGIECATITIQVTFMKKNLQDIAEIIKNYKEMGVDRVKGHHLWITWKQLEKEAIRGDEEGIARWNEMVKVYRELAGDMKLQNFESIEPEGVIPKEAVCPFLGKEAWIAPDGTFNVCCAPDEERKKLGSFGNLLDHSFEELWHSEAYKRLVEEWGNYEPCQRCNMRVLTRED